MSWEVEFTDEFGSWWGDLDEDEQDSIDQGVGLLEARGPSLPLHLRELEQVNDPKPPTKMR